MLYGYLKNCNFLDPKTDTYVDKVACERYRAFVSFLWTFLLLILGLVLMLKRVANWGKLLFFQIKVKDFLFRQYNVYCIVFWHIFSLFHYAKILSYKRVRWGQLNVPFIKKLQPLIIRHTIYSNRLTKISQA